MIMSRINVRKPATEAGFLLSATILYFSVGENTTVPMFLSDPEAGKLRVIGSVLRPTLFTLAYPTMLLRTVLGGPVRIKYPSASAWPET